MKLNTILASLIAAYIAHANTSKPVDAQLWLFSAARKTILAVTENSHDRQNLKFENFRSLPIQKIEIPSSAFQSLLDSNSELHESNILRLRLLRNELLAQTLKNFKDKNKLEYYKPDSPKLKELEYHFSELIEKLYIARALTASLDKIEGMNPRTVMNLSAALDTLIDNSLMEVVIFLNRAESEKISRSEILNMIRHFADVAKLSIPVNSYSSMHLSQIAHPLSLHITGAYKFGQSRIYKTMSCRAFFR